MAELIWATRGRSWGFRFLLDDEQPNPLAVYESAFVDADNDSVLCRRSSTGVALRILDPLSRTDSSGRIIPHDFVVGGALADSINSVEDGLRAIWPIVSGAYGAVWDSEIPPPIRTIRSVINGGPT